VTIAANAAAAATANGVAAAPAGGTLAQQQVRSATVAMSRHFALFFMLLLWLF
jgi:hypothetical protein